MRKARHYESLEQYSEAIFYLSQAGELLKANFGEESLEYASFNISLVNLNRLVGNFKEALKINTNTVDFLEITGMLESDLYIAALNSRALIFFETGDIEVAEEYLLDVLRLHERLHGKNNSSYGMYLNNLAEIYTKSAKYVMAENLYLQSIEIFEKLHDTDVHLFNTVLFNLANLFHLTGRYIEAFDMYEQLLESQITITGKSHPVYASYLVKIAMINTVLANYSEAENQIIYSINVLRDYYGEDHPYYLDAIIALAGLYKTIGRNDEAETLYLNAIRKYYEISGPESTQYTSTLFWLAELYREMGDFLQSKSIINNVIRIQKEATGEKDILYAKSINTLAMINFAHGNYVEAERLYLKAIEIYKSFIGEKSFNYAILLSNLALLYAELGNYDEAHSLYEKSTDIHAEIFGEKSSQYALMLNNIGLLLYQSGEYVEAKEILRNALDITGELLGEDHVQYALILNNLAMVYNMLFNEDLAKALLIRSKAIFEENFADNHPNYIYTLNSLGLLYMQAGNFESAQDNFKNAVNLAELNYGFDNIYYSYSLNNLGVSMFLIDKNYDGIDSIVSLASNSFLSHLQNNFAFMTDIEKNNFHSRLEPEFAFYHQTAFYRKNDNAEITSTSYQNELVLKGMQMQSSIRMRNSILTSNDTLLIDKFTEWLNVKNQVNLLLDQTVEERWSNVDSLRQVANELERELSRKSKDFGALKSSFDIKPEYIQERLTENEAAIEFIHFDYLDIQLYSDSTFYCALILTKDMEYPEMVFLFEESELQALLPDPFAGQAEYNLAYQGARASGTVFFDQPAYKGDQLYEAIWQPIDSLLDGIETIYFAPSGLLHSVSFAAIPDPGGELLMEKYNLLQVSSTRLVAMPERPVHFSDAVVFGGIDYDLDVERLEHITEKEQQESSLAMSYMPYRSIQTRHGGFSYLTGSLEEANTISAMLSENYTTTTFTGSEATEESFKALSGTDSPSIIHIATHGFYLPDTITDRQRDRFMLTAMGEDRFRFSDDPLMRSALVFAGANHTWAGNSMPAGMQDGILTAREVSSMNLSNTSLVVLSACQTGLGDVKGSEGVSGLQRAFMMAGVRYVIMSLWSVPDKETAEFMEAFYSNWLSGMEIRDAFNATQRHMHNRYPNEPYKWAAFVLTIS